MKRLHWNLAALGGSFFVAGEPPVMNQTGGTPGSPVQTPIVVQLRFTGDAAPGVAGEWKGLEAGEGTGVLLQRLCGAVVKRAGKGSDDQVFWGAIATGDGLDAWEQVAMTDAAHGPGVWESADFKAIGSFEPKGAKSGVAVGVDLNAWRAALEKRFDAAVTSRILRRVGMSNARSLAIQAAAVVNEGSKSSQPAEVRVKMSWSARSEAPGVVRSADLTVPWEAIEVERQVVKDAAWVAGVGVDGGGIGLLGPEGGVGSWAGAVRMAVDVVGSLAHADEIEKWEGVYERWRREAGEPLRGVASQLYSRGGVACWPGGDGADVVLMVPAKEGVTRDEMDGALRGLGAACGLKASAAGVWTLPAGTVLPVTRWSSAGDAKQAWVVVSFEGGAGGRLEKVVGGLGR